MSTHEVDESVFNGLDPYRWTFDEFLNAFAVPKDIDEILFRYNQYTRLLTKMSKQPGRDKAPFLVLIKTQEKTRLQLIDMLIKLWKKGKSLPVDKTTQHHPLTNAAGNSPTQPSTNTSATFKAPAPIIGSPRNDRATSNKVFNSPATSPQPSMTSQPVTLSPASSSTSPSSVAYRTLPVSPTRTPGNGSSHGMLTATNRSTLPLPAPSKPQLPAPIIRTPVKTLAKPVSKSVTFHPVVANTNYLVHTPITMQAASTDGIGFPRGTPTTTTISTLPLSSPVDTHSTPLSPSSTAKSHVSPQRAESSTSIPENEAVTTPAASKTNTYEQSTVSPQQPPFPTNDTVNAATNPKSTSVKADPSSLHAPVPSQEASTISPSTSPKPSQAQTATSTSPNTDSTTVSTRGDKRLRDVETEDQVSLDPMCFRDLVHTSAVAALKTKKRRVDPSLQAALRSFQPKSLAQVLDVMASRMMELDLDNLVNECALTLALDHIIDCTNPAIMKVFREHVQDKKKWDIMLNFDSIFSLRRLKDSSKALYNRVLEDATNETGTLVKKKLLLGIARQRAKLLEQETADMEAMKMLEILDVVTKKCVDYGTPAPSHGQSGLTHYRHLTTILDILLEGLDLERNSEEYIEKKAVGVSGAKNMDFLGRQMDVNAASSGVAISTNVWTSDDTPEAFLAEQHCRSYHASKSLLKSIQRLPFDRDVAKTLGCIAMDWTGSVGYSYAMFLLEDDVYFTLPCADLFIPTYVSDLPEFFTTLDALFVWKNDQIDMMNIVMPMVLKQKRQSKLDLLRRRTCSVLDDDGA